MAQVMPKEWEGFNGGSWTSMIDVRDFIQKNFTQYDGDESFLADATQNTKDLWQMVLELQKKEREAGGVLDMDTKVISTITSHGPGYLDKSKETIVGFQTDKPFKRSLQPYGGIRMAEKACSDNGYEVDPEISEFFSTHRKTHNAGCFDAVEAPAGKVSDYRNPDGTYDIGSMAYSISQYFKMGNETVQVRSSGYARFSDVQIPQEVLSGSATVTFTGILTEYKGEAQFTLIDLDGVRKADGTPWYN